jgi:hypothetical protein
MITARSLLACLLVGASFSACAEPAMRPAAPVSARGTTPRPSILAVSWGIPRFFELGRNVRLEADGPTLDTTGWPAAILRTPTGPTLAYLSTTVRDRSSVFVYTEPDPSERSRRYALVVPEPKTFSTNGLVTAHWGRTPLLMNFAPGLARSFASFTKVGTNGPRPIPVRARLEPSGVNPQELENVYELEDSRLDVFEHKGLVPGEQLSFLEFTVYDRESTPDDAEPEPIAAALAPDALKLALLPLGDARFLHGRSFDSTGYRVVFVSDASGQNWFLATPSESFARGGFAEVSTDLTLGKLDSGQDYDASSADAPALELERPTQGWFLCGMVNSESEIPSLLQRGASFRDRLRTARRELLAGSTQEFAGQAAQAFLEAHRSQGAQRTLTRFAYGDAPQPANSTAFSAGARHGQDLGSALRGLVAVQRNRNDPTLLPEIAALAESSLGVMLPSGATFARHFEQLALLAEHDETYGRSDVFLDNGSIAAAINHRRLLLANAQTHDPTLTWGAFGVTIDGQSSSVDRADYEFSVDGDSLPISVSPNDGKLSVSRLFTPTSGAVRVRESVELQRGFPALGVRYQMENHSEHPATLSEARLTLADFLEYGTGSNERSQGRCGLGHLSEGVPLPIGFWMEGMRAPLWGDSLNTGELDLTEQYRSLGARFLLVFGFDRAQLYFLERPADRLILYGGPRGLSRLEARYELKATLAPHENYALPAALTYTLHAPLASVDGDLIPDQLQELAPLWMRRVSGDTPADVSGPSSLDTDSGHAELVYAWLSSAESLASNGPTPAFAELAGRLSRSALEAASFALDQFAELHNRNDLLPTYANGHEYGFHMAIFDWAYRRTCDLRYRDAFLTLANDLVRPARSNGLKFKYTRSPS